MREYASDSLLQGAEPLLLLHLRRLVSGFPPPGFHLILQLAFTCNWHSLSPLPYTVLHASTWSLRSLPFTLIPPLFFSLLSLSGTP
jgi:hypothetical protein